jgi:hypothetical protein
MWSLDNGVPIYDLQKQFSFFSHTPTESMLFCISAYNPHFFPSLLYPGLPLNHFWQTGHSVTLWNDLSTIARHRLNSIG